MNVIQYILDITSKHLHFFSFEKGFTQERFKRFAELAIFFHYISKDTKAYKYDGYDAIKAHLSEKIALLSPDDIFKNFYTAYHIIMPYVFIRQETRVDALEKSLGIVCKERLFSPEIPPHRQMEWDYMLYKIGKKKKLTIPKHCILNSSFYLPFVDRDLTYALTHALFYLTDFGFLKHIPEGMDKDRLAFRIACLVARFYDARDVDVTLELGITFLALYPHLENRAEANRLLKDVLYIIDRCIVDTSFLTLETVANDDVETILQQKYHTFFVLGILATLLTLRAKEGVVDIKPEDTLLLHADINGYAPETNTPLGASLAFSWNIIDSLKKKNYSPEPYNAYQKHFGRSLYLEDEITFYLNIFKCRNQKNILWNSEFAALGVSLENQETLRAQSDNDLTMKMPRAIG